MEHKQHGLEPLEIEEDKQEPIKCYGYRRSTPQVFLTYLLCILSLGGFLLVLYWKPNWRLKMMHTRCAIPEADAVLIQDIYHREHVKYMDRLEVNDASTVTAASLSNILNKDVVTDGYLKFFCYQRMKYIWDPENCTFFILRSPELGLPCHEFTELHRGLSDKDVEIRQQIFGPNAITIKVKPILVMLVQEVLNPFYIFQIYSCMVWLAFAYWTFTIVIIFMTAISIGVALYLTRKHSITLRKMAESFLKVEVLRPDGTSVEEMETELVPGDVILIPPQGCTMTCDVVLINGTCIVNESMLTGESVPVTKVPLASQKTADNDEEIYSPELHKRHTLFCGTKVIQTRQTGKDKVKAVVVQTGFSTFKGSLVRTILYPRPMEFKLYRDAMMFVGFYVALAAVGIIYSALVLSALGQKFYVVLIFTLDTTTIAIQPLLPVALTIGMLYAQVRLKKRGIFCISPQRINLAGVVDVVCFDKTGTLTEDGLDLLGLRRKDGETFLSLEADSTSLPECPFLHTMVTCHSLANIEGQLQGDPMDVKMFEATKWIFEEKVEVVNKEEEEKRNVTVVTSPAESEESATQFTILKQFTFSSALQRMSVIAERNTSGERAGFVKGSPEMILKLCKPTTVPSNFNEVLEFYTRDGFRVISLAWKPLERVDGDDDGLGFNRDDVESDLTFLGFLVWQNALKPESLPAITELQKANIRTVMVTGDNIQTAINVAGKCGMVSPGDSVVHVSALLSEKTEEEAFELEHKKVVRSLSNKNDKVDMEEGNCQTVLMMSGKEHYAIDGKTFAVIQEKYPEKLQEILLHGKVFARMAPSQKQDLVEALQGLEYTVGMCGDGANDCGALKTAHAGISLSEAEASVASPFTSKIENISCVPILIKEGRSALVTSFGLFKYIAMYTFIMFVTTCITKKFGAYPGNNMFTFWEVAIVTPVVMLMGRSGPYDTISEKKPPTRLVTVSSLCSVIYHVIILLLCQAVSVLLVEGQTWYTVFVSDIDLKTFGAASWEGTVTFIVANFQYVIYGLVFAPRPPHQASVKTNPLFLVHTALLTIVCSLIILVPAEKLESKIFEMHHIPDYKFRVMLFFLCVANFLLSFVVEYFIFPREIIQKMLRCWRSESTLKYMAITADMKVDGELNKDDAV